MARMPGNEALYSQAYSLSYRRWVTISAAYISLSENLRVQVHFIVLWLELKLLLRVVLLLLYRRLLAETFLVKPHPKGCLPVHSEGSLCDVDLVGCQAEQAVSCLQTC